jgi:hypothetical protein
MVVDYRVSMIGSEFGNHSQTLIERAACNCYSRILGIAIFCKSEDEDGS